MRNLSLTPELCVCVLSYQRLDLLRTTLRSIVAHLEHVETGVPYELVWVDNGSDEAERQALHREFTFEKALLLGTNYGIAYGFNSLFFRLCSAPYFLSLEEDWEWVGARHGAGATAIRDAMSVLRHDTGISGVFLRPDTLDQFITRSAWKRARRGAAAAAAAVRPDGASTPWSPADGKGGRADAAGGIERAAGGAEDADGVEYATYCMDRSASYMWGAYSNGPGVYDRSRLARLVGRQYGEPSDAFPDPASESNYCYRVGAAGLCSAILRVFPGCEGVHECNARLFKHIGDERSHGYGRGRHPDLRWMLHGSNTTLDQSIVRMRSLDVDPTPHWLSMHLGMGEDDGRMGLGGGGQIALLLAADSAPVDATLLLLMRPKSRTAFDRAGVAYAEFTALYGKGRLAEAWPVLAELLWSLHSVMRSEDWQTRELVGPEMLPAAQELQAWLLDDFAKLDDS